VEFISSRAISIAAGSIPRPLSEHPILNRVSLRLPSWIGLLRVVSDREGRWAFPFFDELELAERAACNSHSGASAMGTARSSHAYCLPDLWMDGGTIA
jgi:hypothetical protein